MKFTQTLNNSFSFLLYTKKSIILLVEDVHSADCYECYESAGVQELTWIGIVRTEPEKYDECDTDSSRDIFGRNRRI